MASCLFGNHSYFTCQFFYSGYHFLHGFIVVLFRRISDKVFTSNNRSRNFISNDVYIIGKGAGKSVQKNFLPQSESDFIYAIIIEEYGLIGGFAIMFFYLLLLFRIVVVANGSDSIFGKLLVLGVGLPIVFQALINMSVAVELFPVTGQNLPLISRGGTSSWMTCLAIGIILSVSNKTNTKKKSNSKVNENNPLEILSAQL